MISNEILDPHHFILIPFALKKNSIQTAFFSQGSLSSRRNTCVDAFTNATHLNTSGQMLILTYHPYSHNLRFQLLQSHHTSHSVTQYLVQIK